jgi:hypothetical protein
LEVKYDRDWEEHAMTKDENNWAEYRGE